MHLFRCRTQRQEQHRAATRISLDTEADRSTEPPFFRPYDRKSRAKAGRGHRSRAAEQDRSRQPTGGPPLLCPVLCVPAFATGQAEARREAAKSSRPPLLCPVGAEQQRKSRPKSRSSRTEAAKAGRAEAKHRCALLSSDFEALLLALVMQNTNRMNRTNQTESGRANYAFEPSGGAGAERIEANELRRANYARTSDGL